MSAVIEVAADRLPANRGSDAASSPMRLLEIALSANAPMEQLERLMALQERYEANEARKAFVAAMAKFKSEPIIVEKDSKVDFTSAKGRTHYKHASLAAVVDAVVSRMGKFGLSHKWDTKQEPNVVTVSCVITHELGHSESVTLSGPRDDSGNKNMLQQIASSITYLQRYTLMSLCGLAARDMGDDDGHKAVSKTSEAVPEGYVKWRADMTALADEGTEKLEKSWKASSVAFRNYTVASDKQWWQETKCKAASVKVPS